MCVRASRGFWEHSKFLFPSASLQNILFFLTLSAVQKLSSPVGCFRVLSIMFCRRVQSVSGSRDQ